jgi:hypothetical protein
MSTSITQLRKKKTELDDENNLYSNIRMNLFNDLKTQPIKKINNIRKPKKKIIKSDKRNLYLNILVFSLIFFFVNNYYLNEYLIEYKFSYYIIVTIKLVLFFTLYYLYKYILN